MTEDDRNNISYFWIYQHDLENWVGWKDRKSHIPPEILKLWEDYKITVRLLDLAIENLPEADE